MYVTLFSLVPRLLPFFSMYIRKLGGAWGLDYPLFRRYYGEFLTLWHMQYLTNPSIDRHTDYNISAVTSSTFVKVLAMKIREVAAALGTSSCHCLHSSHVLLINTLCIVVIMSVFWW